MKRVFRSCLIALFCAASSAFAGPPSPVAAPPTLVLPPPPSLPSNAQDLQTFGGGIPLPEFLRITLGDMGHRAYVLAPDAAQSQAFISADFTRVKLKDPVPVVSSVLEGLGLVIHEVSGVLLIERARKAEEAAAKAPSEMFIYHPKHRPVGSLSSYFSLFPDLKFSYSAGLSVRTATPSSTAPVQQGGAVPQTMSSGATTFSALDQDPSFLVAQGSAADLAKLKSALAELDVPVPEVMLKAYVFEVRDNSSSDSAVAFMASLLGGKFGVSAGSVTGDALRLTLPNLSVAIQSLTADSRVRLVSSPTLRASDGTTASATIGTDTPTLGSIVTQNGSSQQSVSYQSAGVILNVSPRILDDSIRLSISQELSSFVNTDTGLTSTPTKLRRAFKSDVVARSGEALLLGGLSEAQETTSKSKSFHWFGADSDSKSSSQIVVLLQVDRL